MGRINFSIKNLTSAVDVNLYEDYLSQARQAAKTLNRGTGSGSDYLGWLSLPSEISREEIEQIKSCSQRMRSTCDLVVVVGIGGSYLGAKAVIEALSSSLSLLDRASRKDPIVIFAGHNISGSYLSQLKDIMSQYSVGVVVISKSGTTTEPALAFRVIKAEMEQRYGKDESIKRIVAITDKERGALKTMADQLGYETFVIPDNVGGRFSVFTAVGLLPIAIAGFDIEMLLHGASTMAEENLTTGDYTPFESYAAARNLIYKHNKKVEILASFEPKMQYVAEWWKQLYGESEGKQHKGIFPASVIYSTDLHSMGQYVQDGERHIFETFLTVKTPKLDMNIPMSADNLDGLNFLSGKSVSEVNALAQEATILAHVDGGVPCLEITIDTLDEVNLGSLLYFFEVACGISGYMLEVNPFDQPGVEAYKNYMYALLGKEGYEQLAQDLKERLK